MLFSKQALSTCCIGLEVKGMCVRCAFLHSSHASSVTRLPANSFRSVLHTRRINSGCELTLRKEISWITPMHVQVLPIHLFGIDN